MNNKEGPISLLLRVYPALKTAGKIMNPDMIATKVSMMDTLRAVFPILVSLRKYEA